MSSFSPVLAIPSGLGLRTELNLRALQYASLNGYLHERTDGELAGVIFGVDEQGRHGNFHPDSYRRIGETHGWLRRLAKVHTAYKRVRVRANWTWKELDCASSSDALLMNIFCYPGLTSTMAVAGMLANEVCETPEFGFKPRTPLLNGLYDNTEVDMKLGRLLVEAKLTESNFQTAHPRLVHRYRDLEEVFDVAELPLRDGKHIGYQLIRGVLAAHATGSSFCVFSDARRPDLIEAWYRILCAVRLSDLRCNLKLLTWQELAGVLPLDLQAFLALKYGILANT